MQHEGTSSSGSTIWAPAATTSSCCPPSRARRAAPHGTHVNPDGTHPRQLGGIGRPFGLDV